MEGAALGVYALLAGWLTYVHEPWADEAQAWLIARDSGFGELFLKRLHYEGTPGLWHLFLWVLCRLHVSYTAMHWITMLLGVVTAYVLLRYSPFPAAVRLLLPFGFALVYQTAVIARSYSLVPLLVFLICMQITAERKRPLLFALFAALLANTALIGLALAGGLTLVYGVAVAKSEWTVTRRQLTGGAFVVACSFLFAVYTAAPAPDNTFPGSRLTANPKVAAVLARITGVPVPKASVAAPSLPAEQAPGRPVAVTAGYQRALLNLRQRLAAHPAAQKAMDGLLDVPSMAFFIISGSNLLCVVFYAALFWWMAHHRSLLYLFPFLCVIASKFVLRFSAHHTSVLWAGLIAALWITWSERIEEPAGIGEMVFQLVLLLVLVQQMLWMGFAARYETNGAFDGGVATARLLLPLAKTHTVDAFSFNALAAQPYTDRNIYRNLSMTYWPWRLPYNAETHLAEAVAGHPDYIVVGEVYFGNAMWEDQIMPRITPWSTVGNGDTLISIYVEQHGYHETHRFCGMQPAQFGFSDKTCDVVYEPTPIAVR